MTPAQRRAAAGITMQMIRAQVVEGRAKDERQHARLVAKDNQWILQWKEFCQALIDDDPDFLSVFPDKPTTIEGVLVENARIPYGVITAFVLWYVDRMPETTTVKDAEKMCKAFITSVDRITGLKTPLGDMRGHLAYVRGELADRLKLEGRYIRDAEAEAEAGFEMIRQMMDAREKSKGAGQQTAGPSKVRQLSAFFGGWIGRFVC
jgi:hypothetical protein